MMCQSTAATKRSNLTTFISKTLKGRQEKSPLVGKYIDNAKAEPLHLKNNVVNEQFMKLLKIAIACGHLNSFKSFKEVPENNSFQRLIQFVRKDMGCNFLSK